MIETGAILDLKGHVMKFEFLIRIWLNYILIMMRDVQILSV